MTQVATQRALGRPVEVIGAEKANVRIRKRFVAKIAIGMVGVELEQESAQLIIFAGRETNSNVLDYIAVSLGWISH